uniref:Methyltransferase type 11 n=1 Tax=Cyanothece sp. (strain PCC 7425 / ATCC 29141) TaxID=395961 RepID=B8HL93_CYAP4
MGQTEWNTTLYDRQHGFVWQYGESLLQLLDPQSGEDILDLGCGTGHLTAKIASSGASVLGIDADPAMIAAAQQHYPTLNFAIADARTFEPPQPLDAVFSNAVLHWITEPALVIQSIDQALKPGGRFVAELGGRGNLQAIVTALQFGLAQIGRAELQNWNPWYFPSLSEYTTLLETQGFEVNLAVLFDRPTPLAAGEDGLRNWLRMFANGLLSQLTLPEQAELFKVVEAQARSILYQQGQWRADYRRLRIRAIKA